MADLDLKPDDHVANLMAATEGEPDLVRLVGFLGGDVGDGYVRLYGDPALRSWLDLHQEDIVQRERLGTESGELAPRSALYVKGTAMRKVVRRSSADPEVEYLRASPDVEQLVEESSLYDVALDATFIKEISMACLTFRTCRG